MKNLYKKQTSKTIVLLDSIGQNSSLCHNEHMNFTLENNVLRIGVTSFGGNLTSVFDKTRNEELFYQPLLESWQRQDHFLFPFTGRMVDGNYLYRGKTYTMPMHGLLLNQEGRGRKGSDTTIEIVFASNEETLIHYPFPFEAKATFSLLPHGVQVAYEIQNKGDSTLIFGLGGHPAFRVPCQKEPNGILETSGNTLLLPPCKEEIKMRELLPGGFVSNRLLKVPGLQNNVIDLSSDFFQKVDTAILDSRNFEEVVLNKKDGSKIRFHLGSAPHLCLWRNLKGDFVAIEPWLSTPDVLPLEKDLEKKKNLLHLEAGKTFVYSYSFDIE